MKSVPDFCLGIKAENMHRILKKDKGEIDMKRLIAILLCFVVVIGCTACGNRTDEELPPEDNQGNEVYPLPDHIEAVTVENPVAYMIVSTVKKAGEPVSLTANLDENGQGHVEYVGGEKKVATFEPEVLHGITDRLQKSGLLDFDGQSQQTEGEAYASLYVEYEDGSTASADFTGEVPEKFREGYDALEKYFKDLTKDVPVYVPQPEVVGTVNSEVLAEMHRILSKSEIEAVDTLTITDIPVDENFAQAAGLSSAEGITSGTSCAPMMLSTAYSFVIVTVEDDDDTDDVCDDFAKNMEWNKWVCVSASNGLVAEKGNMALCLMGTGDFYDKTANAIKAAGWDDIEELKNPDM